MIDMDYNITETEEHWLVKVSFKINLKNMLIFFKEIR